jgi:hypothetical protein
MAKAPVAAKPVTAKTPATPAGAVPAPVAKAPAAKAPAVKKPAIKKVAAAAAPSLATKPTISAQQRQHYVEVAAFYIAERRGFAPGNPAEDWLAAEEEIARLIATGQMSHG